MVGITPAKLPIFMIADFFYLFNILLITTFDKILTGIQFIVMRFIIYYSEWSVNKSRLSIPTLFTKIDTSKFRIYSFILSKKSYY